MGSAARRSKRAQTQEGILRNQLENEVEDVRGRTEDVRYDLTQELKQLRRELDEQRPSKERVSAEQEGLNRRVAETRVRFDESVWALDRLSRTGQSVLSEAEQLALLDLRANLPLCGATGDALSSRCCRR